MASGVVWIRAVLTVALCVGGGADASEKSSWLALARISSEEDQALLERVRGQSSDLPIELRAMPGPAFTGTPLARWRTVVDFAEAFHARAVFWFEREGPELRVYVMAPEGRHLFVRTARLEGRPGELEWSAGAEAVALVVRSALRAVEAGNPLGDVVPPAGPEPQPEDVVVAAPVPPEPPGAPLPPELWPMPPAAMEPAGWRWQFTIGAMTAWDGYAGSGHRALSLSSGWELRRVRLRLQMFVGLPAELTDSRTIVRVQQYTAGIWVDTPLFQHRTLRWAVGVGVGAHVYDRKTEPRVRGIEPTPANFTTALLAGPETTFRWRFSRRTAVELGVAADALMGRPEFGYTDDLEFIPRNKGWPVRPRVGLSLVVLP
ncbi:hypothetical protein LY474_22590 [Myxococcus stipitatus]|uniref:hypothetical protein n=1 Tax=Myxococcus stipitatus TaxID=83455 RepID=UPI001F40994D|nr:hypothetical protein [Myxococcus stipitatus]MCE9670598.1 hypothetical protein [Myxococcus stipitatus]